MSIFIAYILFSYVFMTGFVFGVDGELDIKNFKSWILFLTAPLSIVFLAGAFVGAEAS